MPGTGRDGGRTCTGRHRCGANRTAHGRRTDRDEEVPLLWIALILLLALAGGLLGALLESALRAVVLTVLGLTLVGVVVRRAVEAPGRSGP